ncbi:ATP-dependent RNA helicase [Cantharellus anzutake]|uniref:ATP-dependent RNA helicase n=1 Tax=Cantharellus anzutake TaxID=1750568 RepID=UPI0019074957|nr:ATP-dependent RNA helicase [Cantharellus anzutake]KAF8320517.1 ATP-dependent RNA helicase [Cantharellus anzutake]
MDPEAPTSPDELLKLLKLDAPPTEEEIISLIEDEWLTPKDILPRDWLDRYQLHEYRPFNIPSLLSLAPSPPTSTLSFVRAGLDGKITGYIETPRARSEESPTTSTSLLRASAPTSTFVRGKSGYLPFRPGGLDDASIGVDGLHKLANRDTHDSYATVPPGFEKGMEFDDPSGELDGRLQVSPDARHPQSLPQFIPNVFAIRKPDAKSFRKAATTKKRDWAHVVDVKRGIPNFHELVPDMAHKASNTSAKYPFELDNFQKEAIYHLEMGDCVFVAAHTSAGKTVVAEYAIALAGKHMTRAIYTSPIKALSNQKFRDFKSTFSASTGTTHSPIEVGILTGDVQINPEATCLIMTTEILRSMLYKGADLIRDVEWVIFDEVHYVNDAERGVVWEEVIIMLPEHVNIILLSATVPNTEEFAAWVGRTKQKPIYVISTPNRPVPLEHYLYPPGAKEIFKIIDSKGDFNTTGYKQAGEASKRKQDKEREAAGLPPVQRGGARGARGGGGGRVATGRGGGNRGGSIHSSARTVHQDTRNLWIHLVGLLKKPFQYSTISGAMHISPSLLPAVIFTFSKKRCEENAASLNNVDLTSGAKEKSEVHILWEKALNRLKGSDKKLPQIERMKDLLSRGIGVHHGGLLPLVKEVVELLFARGLVKILFATETFAMGVNMPARCVVFSGIRKHDGRSFRDILPGEYTQMSGRAGRRGLDANGVVIIVTGEQLPDQATLKTMITGTPHKLQSQFRLTYNMILNLLRVETLKVEEMIKRSFSENATQMMVPKHEKEKNEKSVSNPASKILSPGRIVILRETRFPGNIAVILRQDKLMDKVDGHPPYVILTLLHKEKKSNHHRTGTDGDALLPYWPPRVSYLSKDESSYHVDIVGISSIALVTNRTIQVDINEILDRRLLRALSAVKDQLSELLVEISDGDYQSRPPEWTWSKTRTLDFQMLFQQKDELFATVHIETILRTRINELREQISDQNLELLPDYNQRINVLKDLHHIDENSTVLLKGRVACEINSANELILTELILENTLASYEPEEVVALLSAFLFQEKTEAEPELTPPLQKGKDILTSTAEKIAKIQDNWQVGGAGAQTTLKFGLMEVVYKWAKGMPFENLTELTDVPEGTIVRVITRLEETCREVRDAARVIGDAELFRKMEEAQIKIKRDIVFAASLYF